MAETEEPEVHNDRFSPVPAEPPLSGILLQKSGTQMALLSPFTPFSDGLVFPAPGLLVVTRLFQKGDSICGACWLRLLDVAPDGLMSSSSHV